MRSLAILLCALTLTACGPSGSGSGNEASTTLTIYSARNEQLLNPILQQYTAATGIQTKLVTADAGPLLERLRAEGEQTAADLLVTVDAGNLWQAGESGLLRSLESPTLAQRVPAHLRDPENRWYGLSIRARTIVHHQERAPADSLSSYAALAGPDWKGRLCLRTSAKVYNQSLVAMMIAERGAEQTEAIVKGWVDNLASPPFPNDTAVMEAIAAGLCDVGIVNTYYFGRLQRENPEIPLALFWPDQDGNGVHVNVSGAGVTTHAKHPAEAQALLEWLASPEAQQRFGGDNMEYPVHRDVPPVPAVAAWGEFKQNPLNVAEAGRLQAEAVQLMDRAGYR